MAEVRQRRRRFSRETRLLFATIMVSGVVLLLLARLRFPERPPTVDTSSPPLERLAARASFEELATRIARLEESIAPNLIVLRLSPRDDPPPRRLRDALAHLDSARGDVQHVPALRIGATSAVAAIPLNARISGIVRPLSPSGTAGIVATDPVRQLARVRVPEGPSRPLQQLALSALQTPAYVVAVEGTQAGLTLRPVFLGRSDRFASPRWTRPLLPLGGALVASGALMFTLDGEFLGCAVLEDGLPAIAGATDVIETMDRVATAVSPVDAGVAVQHLTQTVSLATGASRGVVVAHVAEGSPVSGVLEPGDVITAIDEQPTDDPEALLLQLGTRLAVGAVQIAFVRQGKPRRAEVRAGSPPKVQSRADDAGASLLQPLAGVGTRIVAVRPQSPLAEAGLRAEDVIVRAGTVAAPTPAQIRQQLAKGAGGAFLVLVLRRGDSQRVTAVRAGDDAAPR